MKSKNFAYLSALIPLALLFIACSEKDLIPKDDDVGQGQAAEVSQTDIYFNITIAIPSDIKPNSRAIPGLPTTDFRGNIVDEQALNDVTIFIVDYDPATDIDDWTDCDYSTLPVSDNSVKYNKNLGEYAVDLSFSLTVSRGPKHVYAAANLSSELIKQCAAGGVFHAVGKQSSDDYYNVVRQFINDETGAVAMFGAERTTILVSDDEDDAQSRISNVIGSRENPYTGVFTLESMLSKVLLTCDATDDDYVVLKANIPAQYKDNYSGWMKLSSVSFKLGTTNRTTYFYRHTTADGSSVVDPNYEVANQLVANKSGGGWTYASDFADDFTYCSTLNSTFSETTSMPALKYDINRMPADNNFDNRYTTGLYCLENTLDNNWSALPDYDAILSRRNNWFVGPRLIATTIDIESQYIPAMIIGKDCMETNNAFVQTSDMTVSQRLANMWIYTPYCFGDESLPLHRQPQDFAGAAEDAARRYIIAESENPSAGLATYYALQLGDDYYFFTYQGACQLIERATRAGLGGYFGSDMSPFIKYVDGMSFYYTYLNGIADQKPNQQIADLVRNKYYIVHCTYLAVPSTVNSYAVSSMVIN